MKNIATISTLLLLTSTSALSQVIDVSPETELKRLLELHDKDRDKKITVQDHPAARAVSYSLKASDGTKHKIEGIYYLSNLVQELKLAEEKKKQKIDLGHIKENPVDRLTRSIRQRFWDGLTRRIDGEHLQKILRDPKVSKEKQKKHLYVPHHDKDAWDYYTKIAEMNPKLRLSVHRLPEKINDTYMASLKGKHGLLTLALRKNKKGETEGVPFVVPGGRFNEMYGWDSYFHALGVILDGKEELAKDMVDNFVYEIIHYGKILNANRTYYLTRSQPPFLTSMIKAVYETLPKNAESKNWLKRSLKAALTEYETVWMGSERLTPLGLSRYAGFAKGIPPEVEPGHYDPVLKPFAKKHGLSVKDFTKKYEAGQIHEKALDEFFLHDRAVRESGHDTTYRWRVQGKDRCADFATVDLNVLLYKYELDFAHIIEKELSGKFEGKTSAYFRDRAKHRKKLMLKYLWNSDKSLFFDYNWVNKTHSTYLSATTLWPLWVSKNSEEQIIDKKQAQKLLRTALAQLEEAGGLAATAEDSLKMHGDSQHLRQWDWPNGWAPHQIMIWRGLKNYGLDEDADRLIYKWLYMITKNAMEYNGTVPEKYDVVNSTHKVFAEYGNVGTTFSYITREGFGWMNASYQIGLKMLSPKLRKKLELLNSPDEVFGPK